MTVSGVSNVDISALQSASVNKLVEKLSASYEKYAAQVSTTSQQLTDQASTYDTKLSSLGQIQSGFATIQSKATTLQDSATLSTQNGARTALQDVLDSLNAQASLVASLTQPASSDQTAGVLVKESGLSASADKVRQQLDPSSLYGQSVLKGLGVTQASDGTLSLDSTTFNAAYTANSQKVTDALTQLGGTVAATAAGQIASGSALYKSQTSNQSLYDKTIQKRDDLQTRLDNYQARINNLQSGGATAATVTDYSTLTSVATSAAKRIDVLRKQEDSLPAQVTAATAKRDDINTVKDGLNNISTRAETLRYGSTLSSAVTAGAAVQALATELNVQKTYFDSVTAAATTTTAAGSLKGEASLVNVIKSVTQAAASTSVVPLSLASIGLTQGSDSLFSFDQATFNTAFGSNAAGVASLLSQLASNVQTATSTQLADGSVLNKAGSKTESLLASLQQRQNLLETQIATVQSDPFSTVPSSSYKAVLAL